MKRLTLACLFSCFLIISGCSDDQPAETEPEATGQSTVEVQPAAPAQEPEPEERVDFFADKPVPEPKYVAPEAEIPVASRAPDIAGQTLEEVAERTGYSAEEVRTLFPPTHIWSHYGIDTATLADSYRPARIGAVEAPYVHPRVFFGPEEFRLIRNRIQGTQNGQQQMMLIGTRCRQIGLNGAAWLELPPGTTEEQYHEHLRMKRLPRRMGYHGPYVGGWFNKLAARECPEEFAGTWTSELNEVANHRQLIFNLMPYEAFRCEFMGDKLGQRRLARALTYICDLLAEDMDVWTGTDDWQEVYQRLGADSIGITYDWLYHAMSESQRNTVRKFIADVTRGKKFIGHEHVPAYPGNTSNWVMMHMSLLTMVCSIEGEEGFDPEVYNRCVDAVRKWAFVATGPDGAPFEGYNKSSYASHWMLPLARRGEHVLGTEHVKNTVRGYLLATMVPWGGEHILETGIEKPRDLTAIKFAHPFDPVVDLMYASTIRRFISDDEPPEYINIRTTYAPCYAETLFHDDPLFVKTLEDDYDFNAHVDSVQQQLSADGEPLSFYSDFRGLMTTRSEWNRDAAMLLFEPRNVPGGHSRASRNEFVFASHGRMWATRTTSVESFSDRHSVVLIDGEGQGHQCPPGRTLAYVDKPDATFCAGDATWAYSYKAGTPGTDEPFEVTPNDSRLTDSELPWCNLNWSDLPGWRDGKRGGDRHGCIAEHNPVEYAFRTCGLVRGAMPYAVVADNIRKDDSSHDFLWQMQIEDDVDLIQKKTVEDAGIITVVLGDDQGRRLTLIIAQAGDRPFLEAPDQMRAVYDAIDIEELDQDKEKQGHFKFGIRRLSIPSIATDGEFKIVLVPHLDSDSAPISHAHDDAGNLSVSVHLAEQRDVVSFEDSDADYSRIKVKRGEELIFEMD
ncbi:MAG: hypothetical protein AAF456_19855 [Planctomycetota bacterium]